MLISDKWITETQATYVYPRFGFKLLKFWGLTNLTRDTSAKKLKKCFMARFDTDVLFTWTKITRH